MRGTCRDVHFPYLILSLPRLQAFCREKTGNSEHFISSGENAFFKGLMVDLLPRSRGGLEGSGSALANQRTTNEHEETRMCESLSRDPLGRNSCSFVSIRGSFSNR